MNSTKMTVVNLHHTQTHTHILLHKIYSSKLMKKQNIYFLSKQSCPPHPQLSIFHSTQHIQNKWTEDKSGTILVIYIESVHISCTHSGECPHDSYSTPGHVFKNSHLNTVSSVSSTKKRCMG